MRKSAFFFVLAAVMTLIGFPLGACSDKKPAADTTVVDSIPADTVTADTLETLISETPMPKAADELFDDFIFNFAANRKLQLARIKFPLAVENGGRVTYLDRKHWRMEHFFMRQGYYTLILDNRRQLKLMKDTTINRVTIEKIYFKNKALTQFVFNRLSGQWMMTSIRHTTVQQNQNASFLQFYERFSVDSAFQVASMNDLVEFTSPDPDDDFSTQTGSIVPDQWPSFKPELIPSGVIYNILYGQKYTESNQKIFVIRGIASGMEEELVFRKRGGAWKLMEFNS